MEQRGTPKGKTAAARDPRFALVDRVLTRSRYSQDALIEVLHAAQESYGYLSGEVMEHVARELRLPASWVYGVATFYNFFSLEPGGEHTCIVCMGTACYVKRAVEIVSALESEFGAKVGNTTADGKLSLSVGRCLGNCGLAPMLTLDGRVLGNQSPGSTVAAVRGALAGPPHPAGEGEPE